MKVEIELVDTIKEYKWRLRKGKKVSKWSKYYEGILTHKFDRELWGVATQYWDGVLPVMIPFKITTK